MTTRTKTPRRRALAVLTACFSTVAACRTTAVPSIAAPEPPAIPSALDPQTLALAREARAAGLHHDPQTAAAINDAASRILARRWLDSKLDGVADEARVRDHYEHHPQLYTHRVVHVRQMAFHTRADARARALRAYARVKAGESFGAVARETSEDAVSAARGGDMGPIREGTIDDSFFESAAATPVGHVSPPFETPFGFHIVEPIAAPSTQREPLEEVRGQIRARLRREARRALVESLPTSQRAAGMEREG